MKKTNDEIIKKRIFDPLINYISSRIYDQSSRFQLGQKRLTGKITIWDHKVKINNGKHIFSTSHGNENLTKNRVININNTRYEINKIFNNHNASLPEKLNKAQALIKTALSDNDELTQGQAKTHWSYRQNRTFGYNRFSAWWHKNWCQSRAHLALEGVLL